MFAFDKSALTRLALSSVGAVALSAACIGAAVAPARAATPVANPQDWQAAVERQIGAYDRSYAVEKLGNRKAEAVIAVRFTADGAFAGADIARSTGIGALDRHALNVAARIRYPQLPESMQGRPQTVAMRLVFGEPDRAVEYAAKTQAAREAIRLVDAGSSNQAAAK